MKACSKTSHIFLATWLISSFATGCALFRENKGPPPTFASQERAFFAPYDSVWRATQLALQYYPIRVNNMDTGTLETDTIRGYKAWTPPHNPNQASGGYSYYLSIRLIKGNVNGSDATKVNIMKHATLSADFFTDPQKLPSDTLEEKVLLYRIGRELQIDKLLEKAQKNTTSKGLGS